MAARRPAFLALPPAAASLRLLPVFAQIADQTRRAVRLARLAHVTAVQDQPVVRVQFEFIRHEFKQLLFDRDDVLAGCDAGAVGDAKNMRVDRDGRLAERDVEYDVGGFAADPGQFLERRARMRNFAAMALDQQLAGRDDVLGLGAIKSDALDVAFQPGRSKCEQRSPAYWPRGTIPASRDSRFCRWPAPTARRRPAIRMACGRRVRCVAAGVAARSRRKISDAF